MPTKKKAPKTQKAVIKKQNHHRNQSRYGRLHRDINSAMDDVMQGADKLLDCLPRFKTLRGDQQLAIYQYVDEITRNLCSYVDEFEDALPEDRRESPEASDDMGRSIAGALGLAGMIGSILSRLGNQQKESEWIPKDLDVEDKPDPKLLKSEGKNND
jgi:hypothetical protein